MNGIELKNLVGGALQEQFSKAFDKVIENLQNPNTSYRNARKITIELKFVQNEARDDVKCAVSVSEKLATQSPLETSFAIGTDLKTGKLYAHEYGKQIKGQMSVDDVLNNVDVETGEILDTPADSNNVIDLRNVASK